MINWKKKLFVLALDDFSFVLFEKINITKPG